jgi:hypothetical protein
MSFDGLEKFEVGFLNVRYVILAKYFSCAYESRKILEYVGHLGEFRIAAAIVLNG